VNVYTPCNVSFPSGAKTGRNNPIRIKMKSISLHPFLLTAAILCSQFIAVGAPKKSQSRETPYGEWVESDFPFFSSVLDARDPNVPLLANNVTPRGLILNLGNDCWACFDTDLLRISAIWRGKGVTVKALAPGSYHPWGGKTKGGLFPAPEPDGKIIAANGIYPGWQIGNKPVLKDPRTPAPEPNEVGRGPLPVKIGRFAAVDLIGSTVVLSYSVGGIQVREWIRQTGGSAEPTVVREIEVAPSKKPLLVALRHGPSPTLGIVQPGGQPTVDMKISGGVFFALVPRHTKPLRFQIRHGNAPPTLDDGIPTGANQARWPQEVITKATLSKSNDAYVVDDIELPLNNPWKRNVRPGDIQFLSDGTGVTITLDGDVWLARGMRDSLSKISWKRFTSGLHEPMTVAIRNDEIFAFDKNGIWILRDTNGDDEADVHELFSNAFGQTLDMREFPSTIRNAPNGEFVIAKGGQQKTHGKHNGSVLRVSANGKKATLLGYGFRQPAIGVNIRTGLVTSGDQEGQYIPSTPLHVVRDGQFYGYLDDKIHGRENYPAPIADPLTWMPHSVNASAISQVWLFDAKMGALNNGLVHIGFTRPELFQIMLNDRGPKLQAALTSITTGFQHPPLNGSVNPADGQLYIAGFQVNGWGNSLNTLVGMSRVRYTGKEVTLPKQVIPMDKGILLKFGVKLDAKQITNPDNYSLATWHYKRTANYGSAQYKADEEPGIDWHTASSAYLSRDGRSVFVGIPDMKPVMQLRIGWSLATAKGTKFEKNAYTTPYSLATFKPSAEGFGDIKIDLTPREASQRDDGPITLEEGRRLYGLLGCVACHATDGADVAKVGPTWTGLFDSEREVVIKRKKTTTHADVAYLRESILDPTAKVVRGFEKGEYAMPSYAGVVTDSQIESLILFIKSVKDGDLQGAPSAPTKPAVSFE
jgi:mono/diheme cytochrome c family protein